MADWPSIQTHSGDSWALVDSWAEDTFLDGGDTARALFTAPREGTRTLTWPAMSSADLATLKAFYLSQGTTSFNWTDPVTSETDSFRFEPGGISAAPVGDLPGYYKVTAKIKRIGVLS